MIKAKKRLCASYLRRLHGEFKLGKRMEHCNIVYHINSDDGIDGVEVREMASVMYSFAELVQATLDANDIKGDLEVKVRPFKEGSFIAEFALTLSGQFMTLFSGDEANALANALGILGFIGVTPVAVKKTLPSIIRKVKGRINKYTDNGDGTYTYDGITVPQNVHNVVQSPEVAKSFVSTTLSPIVNIGNGNVTVTIQDASSYKNGEPAIDKFTVADVIDFETYQQTVTEEIIEDHEELVSPAHNVVLNPMSGPYDGAEKGYTFRYGEDKWHRVKMHDLEFRHKLETGEIRFHNNDVLIVDLETVQTYDKSGNLRISERRIISVKEYKPYTPSEQLTMEDIIE